MTTLDSFPPTSEERVMAALSHITVLIPYAGLVGPIVIWITQKEKSKYVAFQALQALVYQLIMLVIGFIGMGCYMGSFLITFIAIPFATSSGSSHSNPTLFAMTCLIPLLIIGLYLIGVFVFIVYAAAGAIMAVQGKPFRYIIIGKRVERFMQKKQDI